MSLQIPQIWDDYCDGDPEEIRLRRIGDIKTANEKKKLAQAAARQARAAAKEKDAPAPRRTGRKRKKTGRSEVLFIYLQISFHLGTYTLVVCILSQWTDPGQPADETEPIPEDEGAIEQDQDIFADAGGDSDDDEQGPARPCNLHPDDPANFMKLASVLKTFFAQEITRDEVEKGDRELREYCTELMHVCRFY